MQHTKTCPQLYLHPPSKGNHIKIYTENERNLAILVRTYNVSWGQISLEPRPRYCNLYIFQDGGHRHLGFSKFHFFNSTVKKVELHQFAKFHRNCSNRGRDVSFNIMLVWLENAYSRPFWVFWEHIYPK